MRIRNAVLATPLLLAFALAAPAGAQQPPAAVDGAEATGEGDEAQAGDETGADAAPDDREAAEAAASKVPLAEIQRLVGVYNAVREAYVDPVEDRGLMQSAVRGLLLDLDPHSQYLVRADAQAFDEDTSGAYDGIGVEVMQNPDGSVKVIAPIDDTPAARAGIRAGDVITAVDGKPLTPADAEGPGPLRGPPGSSTVLTVLREGATAPLSITVQRDTIRITSVRARMLEPGYGYVRIASFQADTAKDFQASLDRLRNEAGGRLKGMVIDLRSNPGGLLTSAVQVADDLLESGDIVSTRGRLPISDAMFSATPGDRLGGAPLVVLVDAGSASASEVLAGALRDNNRARVVGSRTFGKGSVQTVVPLDNGDSIKLTTARYYTPAGRSIQARGIDPDVVLKPEDAPATPMGPGITEATLPGHLRGDEEEEGANAGDVLPGDAPINAALAELKSPSPAPAKPPATAPAQ